MFSKKVTTAPELPPMDASTLLEVLRAATSHCALASQINTQINEIERLMLVK